MDSRSFPGDSFDTSFQINPGLFPDQSQLNDLEFDLGDAFDDLNPHNDPFATPFSVPDRRLNKSHPLETSSASITLSQSTLLPKLSPKRTIEARPSHTPISTTSISSSSKQPAPDDFFHIRKRNSNGRIGIDLTSKSTARLWKTSDKKITPEEFEAVIQSKFSFTQNFQSLSSPVEPIPSSEITTQPDPPVVENSVVPAEISTVNSNNPGVVKDTGVTESKLMKPKSISRFSKSSFSSTTSRTGGNMSKVLKVKKQGSKGDAKIKELELERRKSSGSLASIGGGLIDTLMSYGEKIRNSLGLSSNTTSDPEEPTQSGINKEPPMVNEPASPKSPLEMANDLSSSLVNTNAVNSTQVHVEETVMSVDQPPIRTSKKRLLPLSPGRERKRKCIQDENANAYRSKRIPPNDDDDDKKVMPDSKGQKGNILKGIISRPKPLRASRNVNKAFAPGAYNKMKSFDTESGTGRAAPVGSSSRGARAIVSKSLNKSIPGTGTDSQPLFASDVYRQLALEKAQRESRVQFAKPVPPARPTLRPTIPAAFVFRSEERIAVRHADSDEKSKTEAVKRDGESAPSASSKPGGELNRKKQSNPILSTDAPVLNTMIRAKAREKFDNERKEREKILELQRLIREKERTEREEREYKEARKRAIPRANEVPEWYKEAPHKQKYVE